MRTHGHLSTATQFCHALRTTPVLLLLYIFLCCHINHRITLVMAASTQWENNTVMFRNRQDMTRITDTVSYKISPTHKPCTALECTADHHKDRPSVSRGPLAASSSIQDDPQPPQPGRPVVEADTPLKESGACVIQGSVQINHNWHGYLAELRLKKIGGKVYFKFTYPEEECCLKMLIYLTEQVDHLRAPMNCLQKESVLDPKSSQVITLSPSSNHSGCKTFVDERGVRMLQCKSGRLLKAEVERVWYIAASSCGSTNGLHFDYSFIVFGNLGDCPESPEDSGGIVCRGRAGVIVISLVYSLYTALLYLTGGCYAIKYPWLLIN